MGLGHNTQQVVEHSNMPAPAGEIKIKRVVRRKLDEPRP